MKTKNIFFLKKINLPAVLLVKIHSTGPTTMVVYTPGDWKMGNYFFNMKDIKTK